jgi:hypothetical protein
MYRNAIGRRAGAVALLTGIIIGVTGVALVGNPLNFLDSAAAQTAETANYAVTVPFSAKGKRSCSGKPCKTGGTVSLIKARLITISSDDEITARFRGQSVMFFIGENRAPQQAIPLPIGMELNEWQVTCENEVEKCNGTISIVGNFPGG